MADGNPEQGGRVAYILQGEIGVQKAIYEFMKRGIRVYRPLVDEGVDLLIEINNKYYKIQCKTSKFARKSEKCIIYELTKTYHNNSRIEVKKYGLGEVDYFFLFSELYENHPCLIPYEKVMGKRTINIDYSSLKKHPLKNHYKEFELDIILPLCVETLY